MENNNFIEKLSKNQKKMLEMKESGCTNSEIALAIGMKEELIDINYRHALTIKSGKSAPVNKEEMTEYQKESIHQIIDAIKENVDNNIDRLGKADDEETKSDINDTLHLLRNTYKSLCEFMGLTADEKYLP